MQAVAAGSGVHTDGWDGYNGLAARGYQHEASVLRGQGKEAATQLMPRVHRVAALLKRWLLGTHQGAVRAEHLDYYLDEFTFRFNRRTSRSRREFTTSFKISYPVLIAEADGLDLLRKLGNTAGGLPYTVVTDRQGHVLHRKLGAFHQGDLDAILGPLART